MKMPFVKGSGSDECSELSCYCDKKFIVTIKGLFHRIKTENKISPFLI
jgi:hypothetical protein